MLRKIKQLQTCIARQDQGIPEQDFNILKLFKKFSKFYKTLFRQHLPFLRYIGLKIMPLASTEDKIQLKLSISYDTRRHSGGLKD